MGFRNNEFRNNGETTVKRKKEDGKKLVQHRESLGCSRSSDFSECTGISRGRRNRQLHTITQRLVVSVHFPRLPELPGQVNDVLVQILNVLGNLGQLLGELHALDRTGLDVFAHGASHVLRLLNSLCQGTGRGFGGLDGDLGDEVAESTHTLQRPLDLTEFRLHLLDDVLGTAVFMLQVLASAGDRPSLGL